MHSGASVSGKATGIDAHRVVRCGSAAHASTRPETSGISKYAGSVGIVACTDGTSGGERIRGPALDGLHPGATVLCLMAAADSADHHEMPAKAGPNTASAASCRQAKGGATRVCRLSRHCAQSLAPQAMGSARRVVTATHCDMLRLVAASPQVVVVATTVRAGRFERCFGAGPAGHS